MATLIERRPGVWFALVFVPGAEDLPGRQVGRVLRGTKKAVRAEVAAWEAEIRNRAPSAATVSVAQLLEMWQAAKAHQWQPTTVRDHQGRCDLIARDVGSVRLLDFDPRCVDRWLAQLRKRGVGEGAVGGRTTLEAAASWGVSRQLLGTDPWRTPRLGSRPAVGAPAPKPPRSSPGTTSPGTCSGSAAIAQWRATVEELIGEPTRWMLSAPGAADPPSPSLALRGVQAGRQGRRRPDRP